MAFAAHLDCASPRFLAGARPSLLTGRDEQEGRSIACQLRGGSGICRNSASVSRISKGASMNRHSFATLLASFKKQYQVTEVRVAADYPDSKPDASSVFGDLGYHPLEDIPSFEKKKNMEQTDRRLTDAEVARTLAEGNQNAILYASMEQDEDHVFGTEVQYLVDEHGDFYFQIDEDSEFLTSLHSAGGYVNVAIGYKDIGDWILEQQEVNEDPRSEDPENVDDSDDDEDDDDDDDDDGETWIVVAAEGTELVLQDLDDDDSSSSIGDWSGLSTLESVHPLDFAEAIAGAAAANHEEKIAKPSKSLRMVGELCNLNDEEEEYVERLFSERFGDEDNENEVEGEDEDDEIELMEQAERIVTGVLLEDQTEDNAARVDEGEGTEEAMEESDYTDVKTTFYKLEIQNIFVACGYGTQSNVDKTEFQSAKPDILAQCSSTIIERLNACGKALEDTLKALCLQKKGVEAEEVALLEVDSLGLDLRIHCGREVQTIRIPFSQRATSVEHAEQLLDQLLNPRIQHRGRRKRRSLRQGKAF